MADDSSSSEEKSLSWTLVAALLVVGLIVVVGVILSISGLRGDDGEGASPPTASSSSSTTSTGADSDSVCGLPGHESSGALNEAPDATWSLLDGFAVPATKAGPGEVEEDGFRYCYAHTPEGAVLAAANFMGVASVPDLHSKVVEQLIAPGPGQKALRQSDPPSSSSSSAPEMRVQIAGLRLDTYSDDHASLTLLIRGSNGGFIAQPFDLRWAQGDWRVVVADDGTSKTEPRSVPDDAGFLAWSGA